MVYDAVQWRSFSGTFLQDFLSFFNLKVEHYLFCGFGFSEKQRKRHFHQENRGDILSDEFINLSDQGY
jgi:hypothetical protein